MTIKEKFMNEMMENQFKNMSADDKKQMMGNNPMMGMMSMMMGKKGNHHGKSNEPGKMPWDMCCDMMN